MTCLSCKAVIPHGSKEGDQTLPCKRCGSIYKLTLSVVQGPTVAPDELRQLKIGNS